MLQASLFALTACKMPLCRYFFSISWHGGIFGSFTSLTVVQLNPSLPGDREWLLYVAGPRCWGSLGIVLAAPYCCSSTIFLPSAQICVDNKLQVVFSGCSREQSGKKKHWHVLQNFNEPESRLLMGAPCTTSSKPSLIIQAHQECHLVFFHLMGGCATHFFHSSSELLT